MHRRAIRWLIATALVVSGLQAQDSVKEEARKEGAAPPRTAEEILARMGEVYATCKSYRDTGGGACWNSNVLGTTPSKNGLTSA